MTARLYNLHFDGTPDPWSLGDPEPWISFVPLSQGKRVDPPEDLHIPVTGAGRSLDITLNGTTYLVVVTERVASLIEGLAPNDIQRIPAKIEGTDERYEAMHVLARIDCIDWEHTRAQAKNEEGRWEHGTLASLAPLIDRNRMESHVGPTDMALKTEGIEGPRIFRVPDWDLWPIVTDELKTALEQEESPTGVTFQPIRTHR